MGATGRFVITMRPRVSASSGNLCGVPESEQGRDLSHLPTVVQESARFATNGREVMWRRRDAAAAIDALAVSGCIVLGLDLRRYEPDGRFLEVPWSALKTTDETVDAGRRSALDALRHAEQSHDVDDFEWVLVTWQRS